MRYEARTALYCHEFLHKKYAPTCFDLSLRKVEGDDPVNDEYKRLGGIHEDLVLAKIRASSLSVLQIDLSETFESRELQTAKALLRTDLDVILGSSISEESENELRKTLGARCPGDQDRVSQPDLLIRIDIEDGIPIWAPVDVKSHSAYKENKSNLVTLTDFELKEIPREEPIQGRLKREDSLQLAHYMTHLQNIGLAPHDLRAGIIGKDGISIAWVKLDQVTFGSGKNASDAMTEYQQNFLEAKSIAEAATLRNADKKTTVDSMARQLSGDFGCPRCEFKDVCFQEMLAYDNGEGHVTLLAKVTAEKQRAKFPTIESIRELREATGLDSFGAEAQIRARVWKTRVPELIDPTQPLNIPQFDIEIDIDLENSQAALVEAELDDVTGKDQVYLYGYGKLDRTINTDWQCGIFDSYSNYEDTPEAEIDVLMRMWNFLNEEVAAAQADNKTIGIFHYSQHEVSWWRKFAKDHASVAGVPSLQAIDDFISKYLVDLLPYSRQLALRTAGYGIKLLAPEAGFEWKVSDPGGAGSLLYYRKAIDPTINEAERTAARDWLYSYNLDDCRATFAVRHWMRNLNL